MIDLFAGCGGMTSGFAAAKGYRPVMAVEWNLHAAATYAANFGEAHMRWGDIAAIADKDIPRADLIIGGPPCQGFSNLGSRNVEDPRNKLWKEYLRFVRRAKPKVFVIENVDRFQKSAEFALLLAEAQPGGLLEGYTLTDALLPAVDYGVPQRRKRAIVIGSRVGEIAVPPATHGPTGTRRWRTVRDAIEGLPRVPGTTSLPVSRTEFFGRAVPGVFKEADLHLARTPIERSLLRYDCVPRAAAGSISPTTCSRTAGATRRPAPPT